MTVEVRNIPIVLFCFLPQVNIPLQILCVRNIDMQTTAMMQCNDLH